MQKTLIFIFAFWNFGVFGFTPPEITVESGKLIGVAEKSVDKVDYAAYKGIPYAIPPLGDFRFEPPIAYNLPYKGGKLMANRYAPQCVAFDNLIADFKKDGTKTYTVMGSEDCLYLNVFAPAGATPTSSLPVVVFIHGGGFGFGAAKQFKPTYIMNRKDVIVVNINYRLGALGFMSMDVPAYPGNMGLKDQAMALRWIQRNIRSFGGNPGSVTISGMSAGGASTHLAYLSPMMDGLFHRGYSYSGSALVPWGMWGDLPAKTKRVAEILRCPTNDPVATMKCLKHRPAMAIAGTQTQMMKFLFNPFTVFGPTVETNNSNAYISLTPYEQIRRGGAKNIPWITAYTQEDGLYSAAEYLGYDHLLGQVDYYWNELVPFIMFYNQTLTPTEIKEVSKALKDQYLSGHRLTPQNRKLFLDMVTDRLYGTPCILSSMYMSEKNKNIYMYYFRYRGKASITDSFDFSTDLGVGHADDSAFVFRLPHTNMRSTPNDVKMSDFLIDLLVTFAKTGKPPAKLNWNPFDYKNKKVYSYMEIFSPTNMTMRNDLKIGSVDKATNIFARERFSTKNPYKLHPVSLADYPK